MILSKERDLINTHSKIYCHTILLYPLNTVQKVLKRAFNICFTYLNDPPHVL